jgi:hypothetical protein
MDFQYHPFLIGFCSIFFCHYGWSALLFTVVFFKLAFNVLRVAACFNGGYALLAADFY